MASREYTANYRIPVPASDGRFWRPDYKAFANIVDGLLARYIAVNEFQGAWDHSTVYTAGQTVVDDTDASLWQCVVSHTSAPTGTTFAEDRADNPTYWTDTSFSTRLRGTWAYNTAYNRGDFVVSGHIYAMCLTAHTSGSSGTLDDATNAPLWSFLIDATDTVTAIENQTFRPVQIKAGAYDIVNADKNNMLIYTGSGHTWTIDGTGIDTAFELLIVNRGTGAITLDPVGAQVVGGAATLSIPASTSVIITKRSSTEFEVAAFSFTGSQTANTFYAGPTTAPAAVAAFRALVTADLPLGNVVAKSTAYSVTTADANKIINVTASATISLPAAPGAGFLVWVINNHSASNTVDTTGSELIDGAASISLAQYEGAIFIFDGTNYINLIPAAATTPTLRTVAANDTLVAGDNGNTVRVTASAVTLSTTAAATLGAGWRCHIQTGGDYNDMFYGFINPNSSEQVDDQDLVCFYMNEDFDIYCDGSKFYTTRTNGLVFFGEMAGTGTTIDLYQDSVFLDDPEMIGMKVAVDGLSNDTGSRNHQVRVYASGAVVSSSDYDMLYANAIATSTITGGNAANSSAWDFSARSWAVGDSDNAFFDVIKCPTAGDTIVHGQAMGGADASPGMFTGAFNGVAEGIRFLLSSTGSWDAGAVRFWGYRGRRS